MDHTSGLFVAHSFDGPTGRAMATTVRDVMRAPLPGVESTDPVVAAARRLRAHAAVAVPVCGPNGEFLGMLTSADIIDRCVADGRDPRTMQCGSLIAGTPVVVAPDEEFGSRVLGLVLAQPIPMLPVVTVGGRLVGMLTVDDIAGHLLEGDPADDNSLEPDDGMAPGNRFPVDDRWHADGG
jgi:CBS domain-containing protein